MIGLRCKFTTPQQTNIKICVLFFYNKQSAVSVLFKLTFCPARMDFHLKTFLNAASLRMCTSFFFNNISLRNL